MCDGKVKRIAPKSRILINIAGSWILARAASRWMSTTIPSQSASWNTFFLGHLFCFGISTFIDRNATNFSEYNSGNSFSLNIQWSVRNLRLITRNRFFITKWYLKWQTFQVSFPELREIRENVRIAFRKFIYMLPLMCLNQSAD